MAVMRDGVALKHVKEQTSRICIEAVRQTGSALRYVKNQTKEICLIAVKENPYSIVYMKNQTPELCLIAVKQNGLALKFIIEQTDEICREALKQNKYAIRYVKDKDKYEKIFDIRYLKKQKDVNEVIAIKENGKWLFTIGCQRNITKDEFIRRIYNKGGGFDLKKGINVHRKIYLDFLNRFN
ncbi:TPA: DUF4116 domain-containing protein [Clostridioides difficile]|uniref:DUF4116 domain-containing protein n=1 Tax=Clostridioides difficile TaxID=1496 RepID=UPI000BC7CE90|nr:DUF4116 domain-containing protein [Clostridioides difficile]MCW0772746.1 DUF4116 domain-containing protein [Clostridioides difficile]MCW0912233.1 DUF4116 domain-containing protein [Clostridioides difficile]MDI2978633.1 DUF4116 domain-containing protein [Clostridioides difficile]MDI6151634.1 DUF4116 domain-containing protein [Clostridioides difficile]MDI7828048.1 DUF4116 domain-containing protein [Clostridioides difficile]